MARLQAQRNGSMQRNGSAAPGAIPVERLAESIARIFDSGPDAPLALPGTPEPPGTREQPGGFPALIAGFLERLRERCEQQSGRGDEWRSRGQTYRWKLIQDETPKKAVCAVYRISEDGDMIRSQSVHFDSRGCVVVGPSAFREVSERVIRENAARTIPDPYRSGYRAGDVIESPDGTGAAMALNPKHLSCINDSLHLMGNILSFFGADDDSPRMDLLKECISVIDKVLSRAEKYRDNKDA